MNVSNLLATKSQQNEAFKT